MLTKRDDLDEDDEDDEPLYFFRFFSVDFRDPVSLDFPSSDPLSVDTDEYTDLPEEE